MSIFISIDDWFLNIFISIFTYCFSSLFTFTPQSQNSELTKRHIRSTEKLPSHQITCQMKNITILSSQSWFLPNALIKVCWCRPPRAIDYVSADIKRVRDSTLHSMWVAERNSSIRRRGEQWWGFPLKTRGGRAGALSGFFITDCSLKGLVALSFS